MKKEGPFQSLDNTYSAAALDGVGDDVVGDEVVGEDVGDEVVGEDVNSV